MSGVNPARESIETAMQELPVLEMQGAVMDVRRLAALFGSLGVMSDGSDLQHAALYMDQACEHADNTVTALQIAEQQLDAYLGELGEGETSPVTVAPPLAPTAPAPVAAPAATPYRQTAERPVPAAPYNTGYLHPHELSLFADATIRDLLARNISPDDVARLHRAQRYIHHVVKVKAADHTGSDAAVRIMEALLRYRQHIGAGGEVKGMDSLTATTVAGIISLMKVELDRHENRESLYAVVDGEQDRQKQEASLRTASPARPGAASSRRS